MSAGLAMGWRGLSAQTQDRLVRDAWLLTAWWIVVGVACSWLLLERLHLRSPLLRYPITALAIYGVGVVAGARLWLALFSRSVRREPGRFGAEVPGIPTSDPKFRHRRPASPGRDPALVLGVIFLAIEVLVWFESGATLFWWTLLTLAIAVGGLAAIGVERYGSDSLAGILAELSHQFVFGRATEAGFLPPRRHADALPMIVRETRGMVLTLLLFSVAASVALFVLLPQAVSLADIFR